MKTLNSTDRNIKLEHCEANKCEKEVKDFKELVDSDIAKFSNRIGWKKCFVDKCPEDHKKHIDKIKYNKNLKLECIKKHDNAKDYDKCMKKIKQPENFLTKCFKDNCEIKFFGKNNKNTKSKK